MWFIYVKVMPYAHKLMKKRIIVFQAKKQKTKKKGKKS
jgi:hypothetical protein